MWNAFTMDCIVFVCIEAVLSLTCNEHCEMKMDPLDSVSVDEMSRVICAFLNSSQSSQQSVSGKVIDGRGHI